MIKFILLGLSFFCIISCASLDSYSSYEKESLFEKGRRVLAEVKELQEASVDNVKNLVLKYQETRESLIKIQDKIIETQNQQPLINRVSLAKDLSLPAQTEISTQPESKDQVTISSPDETFMRGQNFYIQQSFQQAAKHFESYLDVSPKPSRYPAAKYYLAKIYLKLAKKAESHKLFQEIVSEYPNSSFAKKSRHFIQSN